MNCSLGTYPIRCDFDFSNSVNSNSYSVSGIKFDFSNSQNFTGNVKLPNWSENCYNMFVNCTQFNGHVTMGNNVKNCYQMFYGCSSFNTAVALPNNVVNCGRMFVGCTNFDMSVTIPNSVTDCGSMFSGCTKFTNMHMPLVIPNSVTRMGGMLAGCYNFTSDIIIGTGVTNASSLFESYNNWFNSRVEFKGVVNSFSSCFNNCTNYNKPFNFPSVTSNCNCYQMFRGCVNFAQNITVSSGVTNCRYMFSHTKLQGQTIRFPSSVTDLSYCFNYAVNVDNFNFVWQEYSNGYKQYLNGYILPITVRIEGSVRSNCTFNRFIYYSTGGYQPTGGITIYVNGVAENQFNNIVPLGGLEGYYHATNGGDFANLSSEYVHVGLGLHIYTDGYSSAFNIAKGCTSFGNRNDMFNTNAEWHWVDTGSSLEYWHKRDVGAYDPLNVYHSVPANVLHTIVHY